MGKIKVFLYFLYLFTNGGVMVSTVSTFLIASLINKLINDPKFLFSFTIPFPLILVLINEG
ncbi:MAG: hypothetical protein VX022_02240 [Candidatus Thermoplasmatota archaeon]|nr:hypothetical protein [Candidatus Thermoplasmatota archaeon]